jgi:peptidoglycan lytic transglycosylase G
MNGNPRSRWEDEERRNARIRQLRDEREAPDRRRRPFQPLILLGWFAGVAALVALLIALGLKAFAPGLMSWVQDNPGLVRQGIVRDFVQWYQPEALADTPAGTSTTRITVEVPPGATDAAIAKLLVEKGLVRSELVFEYYVYQLGRQGDLQAGVYDLSPSLPPSQIVAALRQLGGTEVTIRIQEGWRLEQIVAYLAKQPLTMNLDEFVQLVKDPPPDLLAKYDFFANLPAGRTLEGYLYPDTYQVDQNASARQIVEKLLDTFALRLTPDIRAAIAKQKINGKPMTIDQAVTLASIVEREAVLDKERPLIAGVYLNRLHTKGETAFLLQADPTLQYGSATEKYLLSKPPLPASQWGSVDWWPALETAGKDLKLTAALAGYQTYLKAGLPPTPIAAPRIASIEAVANADTASGYFFFVAACPGGQRDGSHYFAKTYAQHLANIAKANAECPAG